MTDITVESLRFARRVGEDLGIPEAGRGQTHDSSCHIRLGHHACATNIINHLCEMLALAEARLQDEQAANIRLGTENRRLSAT